ncbi:MAG: RNA polymerase sigma factor [Deltaproteobacteria bacterium]|nr:RNA polymerase sigma factor [Deltaproteobacteria bacterium]
MREKTEKTSGAAKTAGTGSQIGDVVKRAKEGDRAAFGHLVSLFHEDIFRMVYFRIRSEIDAEDLTQDIFIQAFKGVKRLKEVDRFRPWLFSIAINRVRDFYRKKRLLFFMGAPGEAGALKMEQQEGETDAEPLRNVEKKDFWNQIGGFLKKLSRLEKEVFVLRFLDQLTLREIAETLGKGESTVKTHLYRALKKFKKEPGIQALIGGIQ